ncbi:MAG: hypothetical protein RLZZ437_1076, partial [Pseudomonadota bacterium]
MSLAALAVSTPGGRPIRVLQPCQIKLPHFSMVYHLIGTLADQRYFFRRNAQASAAAL